MLQLYWAIVLLVMPRYAVHTPHHDSIMIHVLPPAPTSLAGVAWNSHHKPAPLHPLELLIASIARPHRMFCKFSDATNGTARTCVPRMRKRTPCRALVCAGHVVDCGCLNESCGKHWFCEEVGGYSGLQLPLMPLAAPPLAA